MSREKENCESCSRCTYENEGPSGEHCGKCSLNYTIKFKAMTNADRIRNMTDDEIAEFILLIDDGSGKMFQFCNGTKECKTLLDNYEEIPEYMCRNCVLNWLHQEREEE